MAESMAATVPGAGISAAVPAMEPRPAAGSYATTAGQMQKGSSPSPDTSPPSGLPRADLSRAVDGGDVLPQKSPVQRQDVAAISRRRRKSYSGELAQPIQVPVPSVLELLYPNAL